MQTLALIIGPLMGTVFAYLAVLRFGILAGESDADHKLGIGAGLVGWLLMLTQSALWATWGMHLGKVIA